MAGISPVSAVTQPQTMLAAIPTEWLLGLVAVGAVWGAGLLTCTLRLRRRQREIQNTIDERTRQLQEANRKLEDEVQVRREVEQALKQAHDALETRVMQRTSELAGANQKLRDEIEERLQAESRIREQAALLDLSPDAIYVRGLDGRIRYWNKGAERLFGWTCQEAGGIGFEKLYHEEDVPRLATIQAGLMESGEWCGELRQTSKDGRVIAVLSRWKLIRDAHDTPQSILVINTDLTGRKKTEEQIQRTRRLESISTLTGGIAHDLNNALAPILIGVDLLRHHVTDPSVGHILSQMESSVKRGAEVVRQMLTFSRSTDKDFGPLPTKHVVENVAILARETFPHNITITSAVSADLWPVNGNASQLQEALIHLCDNAREAMPKGGTLVLRASNLTVDEAYVRQAPDAKMGPHVLIEVADSGRGIAPEIMDKIFDPFFTTKGIGQGSGLGLSSALGLVKNHGGWIQVESHPDVGAQFRVYLPALPETAPKTETTPAEAAPPTLPRGQGETVLIVEDDPLVRDVTRETLDEFGYKTLIAGDGSEALALYAQNQNTIKAVITDLAMPMMDGPATIKALRRLSPELKIITMSGAASKAKAAEAATLGIDITLRKPFAAGLLLEALHHALHPADQGDAVLPPI